MDKQQWLTWSRQLDFPSVRWTSPPCPPHTSVMSPVLKKFSVAENPSLLVTANFPNCLWGPRAKHFIRGGNYIWPQTCSAETFKDIGSTWIKMITNGAWLYHPGSFRTWEAVTMFAEAICKNMGSLSIFVTRMWNCIIKLIYSGTWHTYLKPRLPGPCFSTGIRLLLNRCQGLLFIMWVKGEKILFVS